MGKEGGRKPFVNEGCLSRRIKEERMIG